MTVILLSIINHFFPRIPYAVNSVNFCLFLGYFDSKHALCLNSEIFLNIVIAPLSFREGQYNLKLINYLKANHIREKKILHDHSFIEQTIIKLKLNNVEEMMRGVLFGA